MTLIYVDSSAISSDTSTIIAVLAVPSVSAVPGEPEVAYVSTVPAVVPLY